MEKVKVTTEQLIDKTKQNIYQLLTIGLYNSDVNIKEVYGGEGGLLNLIRGYFCLLEDVQAFKVREEAEQALKQMGE